MSIYNQNKFIILIIEFVMLGVSTRYNYFFRNNLCYKESHYNLINKKNKKLEVYFLGLELESIWILVQKPYSYSDHVYPR